MTAEDIKTALHRGNSTVRFPLELEEMAITRDGVKILPFMLTVEGHDVVAHYPEPIKMGDELPA